MATSSISPVAPARIGALLVPVGKLKRSRFEAFVDRLRPETIVRLGDISPDQRPDRNTFSPLAFPNGVMLYDLSTSKVPGSHQELFPFELHRSQLVVLGVLDGRSRPQTDGDGVQSSDFEHVYSPEQLAKHQEDLGSQYPHAIAVQLLLFDYDGTASIRNAITVPSKDKSRGTTMKTVMCDVSSKLLCEMSVFARTIQAEESIPAPTISQAGAPVPYLMRHNSLRETLTKQNGVSAADSRFNSPDRRAGRSLDEEERSARRASSPAPGLAAASFQPRERSRSPAARETSPTRGVQKASLELRQRPKDSAISRLRDNSRNRSSVYGTASISPSERAKNMVKLRQGLILGNLYLLAGRWSDALRDLVDNTTRAQAFSDHIWYAKGMENILATMILLAWSRMDFTIPPICLSNQERSASLKHVPSSNLVRSSHSIDSNDGAASRTLSNLTLTLPAMVNSILQHYRREDGIDTSGLSQLPFSESVIRLSYMMAVLQRTGGQFTERTARYLVVGSHSLLSSRNSQRSIGVSSLHNSDIAGLIFQAFPPEMLASSMPIDDIISILSGIISVLSVARLYRKRAMIIREALSMLIPRLIQARKVGAAEMGIHPAASLAARHGLTIDSTTGAPILNSGQKDIDFHDLLVVLCETFGVPGLTDFRQERNYRTRKELPALKEEDQVKLEAQQRNFGGFELKTEILRLCANFSESLPNFHDVVQFTSAILRIAGPGSAPASDAAIKPVKLAREDQLRFATKINRTLGVFKAEDATQLESNYWDPFLVRDVTLAIAKTPSVYMAKGDLRGINKIREDSSEVSTSNTDTSPATTAVAGSTLIAGEPSEIVVTLQNLYDFELSIEGLQIVAEGVEVVSKPTTWTIAPRMLQQVTLIITAVDAGELDIKMCRVKVQGCREQLFKLFPKSWKPAHDVKIKSHGLKALLDPSDAAADPTDRLPQPITRTFHVVPAQPRLGVASSSLAKASIDILDGEAKDFSIDVRNKSRSVVANFLSVSMDYEYDKETQVAQKRSRSNTFKNWTEPISWKNEGPLQPLAPGGTATLHFTISGQLSLQKATVRLDHGYISGTTPNASSSIPTRRLFVPLAFSINPSVTLINIQHLPKAQLAAFDILNVSPSPLVVNIATTNDLQPIENLPTEAGHSTRRLLSLDNLRSMHASGIYTTWHEPTSKRHGRIRIEPAKITALLASLPQPPSISVAMTLVGGSGTPLPQNNKAHYLVPLVTSLTLRCIIHNTSDSIQRAIVDLSPRASGPAAAVLDDEDVSRQLAWSGSLRQAAKLGAGEQKTLVLGLDVLGAGVYEVGAEVRLKGEREMMVGGRCVLRAG